MLHVNTKDDESFEMMRWYCQYHLRSSFQGQSDWRQNNQHSVSPTQYQHSALWFLQIPGLLELQNTGENITPTMERTASRNWFGSLDKVCVCGGDVSVVSALSWPMCLSDCGRRRGGFGGILANPCPKAEFPIQSHGQVFNVISLSTSCKRTVPCCRSSPAAAWHLQTWAFHQWTMQYSTRGGIQ